MGCTRTVSTRRCLCYRGSDVRRFGGIRDRDAHRDPPLFRIRCAGRPRARHGERLRVQLLFKLAVTENLSILAVPILAVPGLPPPFPPLYSVKNVLLYTL